MEWVLGTSRGASGPFITTEIDAATGAMLARNPWSIGIRGARRVRRPRRPADRVDGGSHRISWPSRRTCGAGRTDRQGAAVRRDRRRPRSVRGAAGRHRTGRRRDCRSGVRSSGNARSAEEARELIERYRKADLDAVLAEVTSYWQTVLGTVQVKTPDRAMDLMLNGWLLYQTLACRIWARSAFYQASGAYGFRDQLQDGMALTHAQPDETRRHLLRAAARQFVEGDVQHWWLPHSGQGVRTRISDDRVWLAYRDGDLHRLHGRRRDSRRDRAFPRWTAAVARRARCFLPADDRGRIGVSVRALRARTRSMHRTDRRTWLAADGHRRLERRDEPRRRGRQGRERLAGLAAPADDRLVRAARASA